MGSVYSLGGTASVSESWPNDTPSARSTAIIGNNTNSTSSSDVGPNVDPKDTSTIPVLSQVEQLRGNNPSQFQQVVSDAVTKLKVEARQTSDPFAASYLWNLANRFQLALDSGNTQASQEASSVAPPENA
jgi:hypothetical protein